MPKTLKISLLIFCGIVFLLAFAVKSQAATVTFSADTQLDLTGASPTLYINSGSECDSLTVSASTLNADVPAGSTFTLETTSYTVLGLTPAGGTTTLAFDTTYYSGGCVSQWIASSSVAAATVSFSVRVGLANALYKVQVDGTSISQYQSSANAMISFNYTGGFSTSKTFTVVLVFNPGTAAIPLTSPVTTNGEVTATPSLGGKTTLTLSDGAKASIVVPSYAVNLNTTFTITSEEKTAETVSAAAAAVPSGKSIIGDYVYDYTAVRSGETVSSFNKSVALTFIYTDEQIGDLDESTFGIYYWDASSSEWIKMTTSVDKNNNTLTCSTDYFTYFAILGEPVVEEEEEVAPTEEPISEMTIEDLKSEISRISALINQLQTQLVELGEAPAYEGIPSGFSFERNLKYGDILDDIEYLQIILKTEVGEPTYPDYVPISGWFGPITKASVTIFQEKYASDILTPWEVTEGTGFVGKTTRTKLNELLSK